MILTIKEINQKKKELENIIGHVHIDSIFIEQNGYVEKHYYQDDKLHQLRSCSKLPVAMAVGVAIDKGMEVKGLPLTTDTPIYPIIKDLVEIKSVRNVEKIKKWTIKNLLTHTTGYEKQIFSEAYIQGIDERLLPDYALNYDIPYEVGTRYAYNNVEPFVISMLFQEALNINLADFINEHIFKPIGIANYEWDSYGKYCAAGTGLKLRHDDFHALGRLLLYRGKYKDATIINSNWVDEMVSKKVDTISDYKPYRVLPKIGYGYYVFVSRDGFIFRDGTDGQYLIVNTQKNLLISILSSEPNIKNVTEILRDLI